MIVDMHLHPRPVEDYRDGGAELLSRAAAVGIDVLIASDLGTRWAPYPDSAAVREANARLRELARRCAPRLRYLVYLNPQNPDWPEVLAEHAASACGVKLWISCRDPRTGSLDAARAVLAEAGRRDLTVLLHVFDRTEPRNLPGELDLDAFFRLAAACPQTRMIAAHCGGGNWRRVAGRFRRFPNTWGDVSGCYPERGMVETLVRENGADRILYGSDATGRSFSSQLAKVYFARLTPEERALVLGGNARRLFKLDEFSLGVPPAGRELLPYPDFSEDHFVFIGSWPYRGCRVDPAELAYTLEVAGIRRAYAADLDAFHADRAAGNAAMLAAAKRFPVFRPLCVIDPASEAELDALDPAFAGVWFSPYLAGRAADDPRFDGVFARCAERGIPIWLNCCFGDFRFRRPDLAARPVEPGELAARMAHDPACRGGVQGWDRFDDTVKRAPAGWRFECSRLGDGEFRARDYYLDGDPAKIVAGSEYPLRDYGSVIASLTGRFPALR